MNSEVRIRVFLVDDLQSTLDAHRLVVDAEPGFVVVGASRDLDGMRARIAAAQPDIVLLDHRLDGSDRSGLDATAEIAALSPRTRVVLVTAFDSPEIVHRAHRAGVAGVVCKGTSGLDVLLAALRTVAGGGTFLDQAATRAVRTPELGVTPAEERLLRRLVEQPGASVKRLAVVSRVQPSTIKSHLKSLYDKTRTSGLDELRAWAERRGFL
ncbi:MAG: response regulator transcription factor [Planctomycetota bacterium]